MNLFAFLGVIALVGAVLSCAGIAEHLILMRQQRREVLPPPDRSALRNSTECEGEVR